MLTGLGHLLARDNGYTDVRFLSVDAIRDTADTERLIGMVFNPFLLRFRAPTGATLGSAVSAVSDMARNLIFVQTISLGSGQVQIGALDDLA